MADPVYAAEEDLNIDPQRLVELTDNPMAVGVKDPAVIARLLNDASREIDGVLFGMYLTPIPDPVPSIVRIWTGKLARIKLYQRRENIAMPDSIKIDVDAIQKSFDWILSEKLILPCPRATSPSSPAPSDGVLEPELERVFGRAKDRIG